jgi:hypothetical protein
MKNISKQEKFLGEGITKEFEKAFKGVPQEVIEEAVDSLEGFSRSFLHVFPLKTVYPHCLIVTRLFSDYSICVGKPIFNNHNEEPIGYDVISFNSIPSSKSKRYGKEAFSIAKDLQRETKGIDENFD